MTPTDTELAKFYNLTRQTVGKYRKSDTNMYKAMVLYYNNVIINKNIRR